MILIHVTTVAESLNFFSGQIGYLQHAGYNVHVASAPGTETKEFARDKVAVVHEIPMTRSITPLRDCVSLYRLWRLFRKVRPDIVHSHTPKAGLLGTLAARLARVDIVFLSVFGLRQMTTSGLLHWVLDWITWIPCYLADRVWCDSFSMRDQVIHEGLCKQSKIVVLGSGSVNGVNAELKFCPQNWITDGSEVRKTLGIPGDSVVLGYIGRIVKDKGMHELVEAWKLLRDRYPHLHMILVGPFDTTDPLLPADKQVLGSDNRIHLAGSQKNVAPFFAAMDIYVMPSYREGFGITNIEASAMELPIVSTRIPGCVDSVEDGVTGTLVPPRDSKSLAAAIQKYVDNPEVRKNHGKNGRERVVRDFRPETIWAELSAEYLKAKRH